MEKDTNSVNMSILYFYAISTNALLGEKRKKTVFLLHTLYQQQRQQKELKIFFQKLNPAGDNVDVIG